MCGKISRIPHVARPKRNPEDFQKIQNWSSPIINFSQEKLSLDFLHPSTLGMDVKLTLNHIEEVVTLQLAYQNKSLHEA